ncbi:MAG: cytochrome c [Deltaproteobacteria bacterium]|nr:cytochrome c [Deltaproteobacteria bacterium]
MKRAAWTSVALVTLLAGCRGQPSEKSPVHLIEDMDFQPKYQAMEASSFFADGRSMRPLVAGTIAQGMLEEDDAYFRGKNGDSFVSKAPIEVTEGVLHRGQERFDIFCAPCHDRSGSGRGMAVRRGFPPPIDLSSERGLTMPDGEIFQVISNGVRNMPSYRSQIPVDDRWAIVAWVRVLQRSQHGSLEDVPEQHKKSIESESGAK